MKENVLRTIASLLSSAPEHDFAGHADLVHTRAALEEVRQLRHIGPLVIV
jgi:hypothetical protein